MPGTLGTTSGPATNLAWRLRRGAPRPHHGGVTTATTPVARLRTLRSVVAGAFFDQGLLLITHTRPNPQKKALYHNSDLAL